MGWKWIRLKEEVFKELFIEKTKMERKLARSVSWSEFLSYIFQIYSEVKK